MATVAEFAPYKIILFIVEYSYAIWDTYGTPGKAIIRNGRGSLFGFALAIDG